MHFARQEGHSGPAKDLQGAGKQQLIIVFIHLIRLTQALWG